MMARDDFRTNVGSMGIITEDYCILSDNAREQVAGDGEEKNDDSSPSKKAKVSWDQPVFQLMESVFFHRTFCNAVDRRLERIF